jgi:hypothetical protein
MLIPFIFNRTISTDIPAAVCNLKPLPKPDMTAQDFLFCNFVAAL